MEVDRSFGLGRSELAEMVGRHCVDTEVVHRSPEPDDQGIGSHVSHTEEPGHHIEDQVDQSTEETDQHIEEPGRHTEDHRAEEPDYHTEEVVHHIE